MVKGGLHWNLRMLKTLTLCLITGHGMSTDRYFTLSLVQYKEAGIIKTIAQLLGDILLVDDVSINLNGLFFEVLVEVDLQFSLKRLLVINKDDDNLILVSYEKIFEVFFYCGHMRLGSHLCPEEKVEDGCFMIEIVFDDEPPIFPEDTPVDKDVKVALQDDILLCFPTHVIQDEEPTDNVGGEQRMVVDRPDEDA